MTNKLLPTLQDVANHAGVSKAVASRAFSKEKRPISALKKQKVLDAAKELGYVINPFAQSLNNKSTGIVAIVVNHISDLSDLELFDQLLVGLQSIGKLPIFIRLQTKEDIKSITDNAFVHRVDAALIFSDLITPSDMPKLFLTNKVINLNGQSWDHTWSILFNEKQAIKQAVDYLAEHMTQSVHILAGRQCSAVEQSRIESYQDYLSQRDIQVREISYCDYKYLNARHYLENKVETIEGLGDALICTSDAMAMAAIDCFARSSKPPVVIGFDNTFHSHFGSFIFPSIGYPKTELIEAILEVIQLDESDNNITGNKYIEHTFSCED